MTTALHTSPEKLGHSLRDIIPLADSNYKVCKNCGLILFQTGSGDYYISSRNVRKGVLSRAWDGLNHCDEIIMRQALE